MVSSFADLTGLYGQQHIEEEDSKMKHRKAQYYTTANANTINLEMLSITRSESSRHVALIDLLQGVI